MFNCPIKDAIEWDTGKADPNLLLSTRWGKQHRRRPLRFVPSQWMKYDDLSRFRHGVSQTVGRQLV